RLDPRRPLGNLGMDSLMSLEMRNRLEIGLGMHLPATVLWSYPTIAALAEYLAGEFEESLSPPDDPAKQIAGVAGESVEPSRLAEIQQLSDAEAEAALTRMLAGLDAEL
ncbi:MAG TPA: phosphopantetheine-binding protein, partial [Chloroflexota bacterium]|nr:phosphopantetheine-binding protein [Chloroflexota bacterium]